VAADDGSVATPFRQRVSWKELRGLGVKPRQDPRLLARFTFYLYAAGGALTLITLGLPGPPARNELAIAALAGCAYAASATVLLAFDRLRMWAFELLAALGTVLITASLYFTGESVGAYRLFYFWVGLSAFYFFSRRRAFLQLAFIGAAYGVLLALLPPPNGAVANWLIVVTSLAVAGVLVSLATDRLEHLWERERAVEARYRSLVEQIPLVIYIDALDENSSNIYTSPQIEALVGYSPEEWVADAELFQKLLHPDDRTRVMGEIARSHDADAEFFCSEYRLLTRDGRVVWIHDEAVTVRDEEGHPLYAQGYLFDITARKLAEMERERLLAAEQAARTEAERARGALARQNADLLRLNERLVELDRLKDEFVALVSHELRTPLTSIRGYLELIREGKGGAITEKQEHFLEVMNRNSERLLRLVSDLLFVAQAESGKVALELESLDLAEVAKESIDATRPLAAKRTIALNFAAADELPLSADRARLVQLLDNLLSNALKFTPEGGRVDVTLSAQNGHAVLEVADSGIGIPRAEQDRLFERFYRASTATAQAVPGTGLGLAIAKAIVDAHGGNIEVESDEGSGSLFRVELPVGRKQRGRVVARR
jgi:PAS domain S-box-containing protein